MLYLEKNDDKDSWYDKVNAKFAQWRDHLHPVQIRNFNSSNSGQQS